jgi:methylamine dehydrogenase heavy chain
MPDKLLVFLCLALCASFASAELAPETVGKETLGEPGENWVIGKTRRAAYIFDADSGEMQGLVSLSNFTSAFEVDRDREQIYAPESYFSREIRGERTDIVAVYDFENLAPVAEIPIPHKVAVLPFRRHVGMLNDGRHFLVFNMSPAQSVTVVDVETRAFVDEVSTPGCAMIMPVEERDFLMICGDGTLQLIQLGEDGKELNRERSKKFFDVLEDPIFDRPVPTADGWLLTSHAGRALEVTVESGRIRLGDEWSLTDEQELEAGWRPGGGEFIAHHEATGLTYVLMHQSEEEFTHHESGTEIWVLHSGQQRRLERMELEVAAHTVYVTQSDEPKLIVSDEENGVHVYDAIKLSLDQTIEDPGPGFAYFTAF